MSYLGVFRLESEETNVIFEISTLEFVSLQNLAKKTTKMPKFVTKNALFGYFWDKISKNYCNI